MQKRRKSIEKPVSYVFPKKFCFLNTMRNLHLNRHISYSSKSGNPVDISYSEYLKKIQLDDL